MCFKRGMEAAMPHSIFEIARKLVKKLAMLQESFSVTFFLVTVVGQIVKTPPSPIESVSAHLWVQ